MVIVELTKKQIKEIRPLLDRAIREDKAGRPGAIFTQLTQTASGRHIVQGDFIKTECAAVIKGILDNYYKLYAD